MLHVDVTMLDDDINKLHVTIGDKLIVQLYKGTNDNCKQMYIYLSLAYISISCINMQTYRQPSVRSFVRPSVPPNL